VALNSSERTLAAGIFLLIALVIGADLFSDLASGGSPLHLASESAIAILAMAAAIWLHGSVLKLKRNLTQKEQEFSEFRLQSASWRADAQKFIQGLSQAIDEQLGRWNLSSAEREVAFLLLKGLSMKEIAGVRHTSEKTARSQAQSVYTKSGLSGRSELAAFFLEDLLLPPARLKMSEE